MSLRDTLKADFERNSYPLTRLTLVAIRLSQYAHTQPRPARLIVRCFSFLWIDIIIGAEIPGSVRIGPGLQIPHAGRGLIFHPNVVIGSGATIYHRVTIGVRGTPDQAPVLGDEVYVGAGASILGAITLGNGARVGAGTVVLTDIPAGRTVVGAASRLLPRVD